jgi:hypothetical protein
MHDLDLRVDELLRLAFSVERRERANLWICQLVVGEVIGNVT